MFKCDHCIKEFQNKGGLVSHEPYCKQNPNRVNRQTSPNAGRKKGCIAWNKGLKTPDHVKEKLSKALTGVSTGKASTEEKETIRRLKISESMKRNPNAGGLRNGSSRGKKGRYMGVWCDSTWELAWVIYHIEKNIPFERNNLGFKYSYRGKEHVYYPDFKIGDKYVEIKGRRSYDLMSEKDKIKIESFKYDLDVLFESEMNEILKYAIDKYGKDLENLYQ